MPSKAPHMIDEIAFRRLMSKGLRNEATGCLEFQGYLMRGYGQLQVFGRTTQAHRLIWAYHKGDAGKLLVRHLCHNKSCFALHLAVGTARDNYNDNLDEGGYSPLTVEKVVALRELAQANPYLPWKTIGERFGISAASASETARGESYPTTGGPIFTGPKNKCPEIPVQELIEGRKAGLTVQQLVAKHGVDRNRIRNTLYECGVMTSLADRRKKQLPLVLRMHAEGTSEIDIAEAVGIGRTTVRRWLEKYK